MDDFLGPGENRFFGLGFRRVSYTHSDILVSSSPENHKSVQVSANLKVQYPEDWSKKGSGRKLRPHFSTIDGLVTAAELTELCIIDHQGDGTDKTSSAWLRSVRISAGSEPMEDLGRIPLHAVRRSCAPWADDPTWSVSIVDNAIGNMRVRCEVVHPATRTTPGEYAYRTPDDVLGDAADRYFARGFTSRRQEVRNVVVDPGTLRAEADLSVVPDGRYARSSRGLEGGYQPSVSMVDGFVTALQLAQVMLYDLDDMRRQDSDTLWMRQTTLSAARPDRPSVEGVRVSTGIAEPNRVRMGGFHWRTGDIVGDLGGVRVKCAVAHRLREGEDR